MFSLRFDMRAPANGASTSDLYRAAIEMCAWAETRGGLAATLCEHHKSADGYLPSPLILASAIASRTTKLPITIAIFQLPLYNPVKVAEEMAVLDIISGGRVSYVGGLGYLPWEYEMLGAEFKRRGAIADESLALLLRAKTGEAIEHDGRRIQVTPPPVTPGGPQVGWGGGSLPAARRAGRFGLNFLAQNGDPALRRPMSRPAGRTAIRRGCACCPRETPRRPSSSPTTSTGPGTNSGPT
jgi:alkanesulfonate monooxygenase SsuD/methylene tetrahydromethanopterin reductase-like flavin-dependent oxidoreductase (luciferase family)